MTSYQEDIMDNLKGETPKQKYEYLISVNELFEEMVGLHSKRYDDEECGVHFNRIFKKLINQYQS